MIRRLIARVLGPECAYSHLAAASVDETIKIHFLETGATVTMPPGSTIEQAAQACAAIMDKRSQIG